MTAGDTRSTVSALDSADLARLPEARSEAVSADGLQLAWLSNVTGSNQIWTRPFSGGAARQLTRHPERITSFAFNPKSRDILFVSDVGGNERWQFWLLRDGADQPENLTRDPASVFQWGAWSPDGTALAYTSNARDPEVMDLHLLDIASGQARRLLEGQGFVEALGFTPDGSAVLLRDSRRAVMDQELQLLDIASGKLTTLPGTGARVRYLAARFMKDGRLLALTDRGRDFHGLYEYAPDTGIWRERVLIDGADIDAFALAPDQVSVALVINREGYSDLVQLRLDDPGAVPAPITLPFAGVVNSLRYTPDGAELLLTLDSPVRPADLWRCDTATGAFTPLLESAPRLPAGLIEPKVERFTAHDGLSVPALVYRPAGPVPPGGWPVLFLVHGGPEGQWQPNWRADVQRHLSRGVMVVAPNVRGSTGYGRKYHEADDHARRMESVADLHSIREAVGRWPEVDAARIAVQGQSYGGFMVLAALTERPDLWCCGVDLYGISNFPTLMLTTGPWRRVLRAAEYGDDPGLLAAISPIHRMDRVAAPLLLVHCFEDPRVPMEQSEQVLAVLRGLGRPVDILRIEHEGHGFARTDNRVKAHVTIAAFLDRHLGRPGGATSQQE